MATVELMAATPRWNPATRIGFRFLFVYFFVCVFAPFNQLGGTMLWNSWGFTTALVRGGRALVTSSATKVFGATITTMPNGSGDTTFNYVELFCWAAIAATRDHRLEHRGPETTQLSPAVRGLARRRSIRPGVPNDSVRHGQGRANPVWDSWSKPARDADWRSHTHGFAVDIHGGLALLHYLRRRGRVARRTVARCFGGRPFGRACDCGGHDAGRHAQSLLRRAASSCFRRNCWRWRSSWPCPTRSGCGTSS